MEFVCYSVVVSHFLGANDFTSYCVNAQQPTEATARGVL